MVLPKKSFAMKNTPESYEYFLTRPLEKKIHHLIRIFSGKNPGFYDGMKCQTSMRGNFSERLFAFANQKFGKNICCLAGVWGETKAWGLICALYILLK